jgi:3-methyladenine DNA glycosylase Tag
MTPFAQICARAAARKGGEAALASLLGPVPDNAAVADIADDRVLAAMAQRIFAAGFVRSVIESKWPGFEDAFLGFEPKRLAFQPDDFWHDLSRDARIVRNPQNIRAVRDNAGFVARVSEEHGGFGRFLARWPADDQLDLTAWLAKNGSRVGGNTGAVLLRAVERRGRGAARRRSRHRAEPDGEEGPCEGAGADQCVGGGDRPAARPCLTHPRPVDRREPRRRRELIVRAGARRVRLPAAPAFAT